MQIAKVIHAKLAGEIESVRLLDQTPHSLLWNFDALGYISMGIATLVAIPALGHTRIERWVRIAFWANALVTPLITFVYFHPSYSTNLLFIGFPWAITAPASMLLLAFLLKTRADTAQ